jgi:hypothetical protein
LELREQGVDVLLLSVGDPDSDSPRPIVQPCIVSRHRRRSGLLMREEYRQRRNLVCTSLDACPGLRAVRPDGRVSVLTPLRAVFVYATNRMWE